MNVLSTVLTPEQKVQVKAALESSQSDNQGDQDKEPTSVNGIDPVSGIVATMTFFCLSLFLCTSSGGHVEGQI